MMKYRSSTSGPTGIKNWRSRWITDFKIQIFHNWNINPAHIYVQRATGIKKWTSGLITGNDERSSRVVAERRVGNYPVLAGAPCAWYFPIILRCLYYIVLYCTLSLAWLVLGGAPPSTPSQGSRARAKLRPNWTKYVDLDNCALWGAPVQFWLKKIDSDVAVHWSLSHTLALDRNMTNFMRFTWVRLVEKKQQKKSVLAYLNIFIREVIK